MLSKGFQSGAYKELLARQEAEDAERQKRLEELRRKQLREDIKRRREEEDLRRRTQAAKDHREAEARQAKLDQERNVRKKAAEAEEEERRKRPLSVDEAKARREKSEAARSAVAVSKARQPLPALQINRPISSRYSTLLASAPTKLERVPPPQVLPPHRGSQRTVGSTGSTPRVAGIATPPARLGERTGSAGPASGRDKLPTRVSGPERGESPVSQARVSNKGGRALPQSPETLQPLQKQKRDLRTIEEIQNDLHRRQGKNYAHLGRPSPPPESGLAKRATKIAARRDPLPAKPPQKAVATQPPPMSTATAKKSAVVPGLAKTSDRRTASKRTRELSSDSDDDSLIARPARGDRRRGGGGGDNGLAGESIWDILNPGKKRDAYLARDIDSEEEDMEANAEDIRREEQRAQRAARLEDEKEARLLQEQEARKAAKKRRLVGDRCK